MCRPAERLQPRTNQSATPNSSSAQGPSTSPFVVPEKQKLEKPAWPDKSLPCCHHTGFPFWKKNMVAPAPPKVFQPKKDGSGEQSIGHWWLYGTSAAATSRSKAGELFSASAISSQLFTSGSRKRAYPKPFDQSRAHSWLSVRQSTSTKSNGLRRVATLKSMGYRAISFRV